VDKNMARPCTFKQQDVTRALRGADAAGCPVRRVEIDRDGKIILVMVELNEDHMHEKPPRSAQIVL
jgi:hypothetical protein